MLLETNLFKTNDVNIKVSIFNSRAKNFVIDEINKEDWIKAIKESLGHIVESEEFLICTFYYEYQGDTTRSNRFCTGKEIIETIRSIFDKPLSLRIEIASAFPNKGPAKTWVVLVN